MTRFAIAATVILLFPVLVWSQQPISSPAVSSIAFAGIMPGGASDLIGDTPVDRSVPRPAVMPAPAAPLPAFHETVVHPILPAASASEAVAGVRDASSSLQMFSGVRIRDVIQLSWITASMTDILGFEVERRSQLSNAWEMVAYMRSDARRRGMQEYSFLDHLRSDGVAYYRLRQIRADGTALSSPVVSVTPDDVPASTSVWQHATQPFQTYGTVSFGLSHPAEVKLTLCDHLGQTIDVILDNQVMSEGHHIIPFAARDLKPGMYFLRFHSDTGSHTMIFMRS